MTKLVTGPPGPGRRQTAGVPRRDRVSPMGDDAPERSRGFRLGRAARALARVSPIEGCTAREVGKETNMFLLLAIILAAAWIAGFTVMHVTSFAIHLLLILAIASVVLHLFRGGPRAT